MTQISIYQPSDNQQFLNIQIEIEAPESFSTLKQIAQKTPSDYFFLKLKSGTVEPDFKKMNEWLNTARHNDTFFGYSDYLQVEASTNSKTYIPTIHYQAGSIRDDFNFGALVLIKAEALQLFINQNTDDWKYAGFYAFRLW
ncbi:MAG: hypothetical protein PF436_14075, partial [Prolixibacteraceae bacterium]|nr:hypothetical protein [Prolixibacteraceae bacterium]